MVSVNLKQKQPKRRGTNFIPGTNLLERYRPTLASETTGTEQADVIDLETFLEFGVQCCNCLELLHKNQSMRQGKN